MARKLEPDVIVRVKLRSVELGGRKTPIPPIEYGCPFFFEGEGFDCRLLLDQANVCLEPGGPEAEVPVKFLWPELIKPRLKPGDKFTLWEGKDIADGQVVRVCASDE